MGKYFFFLSVASSLCTPAFAGFTDDVEPYLKKNPPRAIQNLNALRKQVDDVLPKSEFQGLLSYAYGELVELLQGVGSPGRIPDLTAEIKVYEEILEAAGVRFNPLPPVAAVPLRAQTGVSGESKAPELPLPAQAGASGARQEPQVPLRAEGGGARANPVPKGKEILFNKGDLVHDHTVQRWNAMVQAVKAKDLLKSSEEMDALIQNYTEQLTICLDGQKKHLQIILKILGQYQRQFFRSGRFPTEEQLESLFFSLRANEEILRNSRPRVAVEERLPEPPAAAAAPQLEWGDVRDATREAVFSVEKTLRDLPQILGYAATTDNPNVILEGKLYGPRELHEWFEQRERDLETKLRTAQNPGLEEALKPHKESFTKFKNRCQTVLAPCVGASEIIAGLKQIVDHDPNPPMCGELYKAPPEYTTLAGTLAPFKTAVMQLLGEAKTLFPEQTEVWVRRQQWFRGLQKPTSAAASSSMARPQAPVRQWPEDLQRSIQDFKNFMGAGIVARREARIEKGVKGKDIEAIMALGTQEIAKNLLVHQFPQLWKRVSKELTLRTLPRKTVENLVTDIAQFQRDYPDLALPTGPEIRTLFTHQADRYDAVYLDEGKVPPSQVFLEMWANCCALIERVKARKGAEESVRTLLATVGQYIKEQGRNCGAGLLGRTVLTAAALFQCAEEISVLPDKN